MEEGSQISADALPPQRIPSEPDGPLLDDRLIATQRKLAGAPISWGVCEVPGWGHQLPPDRVLGEMASLGLSATELGPLGYLSGDPGDVRELLDRFGLGLVAGFAPLVLHDATPQAARDASRARPAARELGPMCWRGAGPGRRLVGARAAR